MARPLRIEFAGAVYHVTSRGDRREPIYRDDTDRVNHLQVISDAMERFDACALAYCLMGNHFHLVLQTRAANLSRLMRHINGVYTQRFNRRHGMTGHLLQGRFKAILVDRDAYLLRLCRYVDRNPVAAGLVADASGWTWSSCRAHLGLVPAPAWLNVDPLHTQLLGQPPASAEQRQQAAARYAALLQAPGEPDFWASALRQQVFLGDEGFVRQALQRAPQAGARSPDVPRQQRQEPVTLQQLLAQHADRAEALRLAHRQHGISMTQMAAELGRSVSWVSRLINKG